MRKIKEIVQIFKVLGDEHRLRILLMLKKRPMYVCRIQEVLDIALSTVSQQLKLMSMSGYILKTREGSQRYLKAYSPTGNSSRAFYIF